MQLGKNWIAIAAAGAVIALTRFAMGQAVEMHDISFKGVGGLELHGTLMTPECKDAAGCPAILLIPGSGPTDRDGNQKPYVVTDLLKQTAERMSTDGFATLRFDKRAFAEYKEKWPKDPAKFEEFFSWDSFVGDAEAAFRILSTQKGIDPKRVGIFGHSEGAIIAVAAATAKAESVAPNVLILAGMPGRKLADCVEEQLRDHLPLMGKTDKEIAELVAANADIMKLAIEQGKIRDEVPNDLKGLYPKGFGTYLQKYLALNPSELVAQYAGPVLLIQGEKDAQTNPKLDLPLLEAASKARKSGSVETFIVKDGSHNLKRTSGPLDPGFTGPVDADMLNKTVNWLRTNLAERK
ncbi:MAG: alpha/beta hydrolase [Planctomycetes bacterium]|nr:alpha/beta hydrolase [Planctomycetota bacterium]MBI3833872.1 alpha/beta hydrolase [Planctomycetota bacterium]